jgi:hypothetical protein
MKKITLPICSAKKGLKLILNSNQLKFEVKILYPNMVIVNNIDLPIINKILERNYINISY